MSAVSEEMLRRAMSTRWEVEVRVPIPSEVWRVFEKLDAVSEDSAVEQLESIRRWADNIHDPRRFRLVRVRLKEDGTEGREVISRA